MPPIYYRKIQLCFRSHIFTTNCEYILKTSCPELIKMSHAILGTCQRVLSCSLSYFQHTLPKQKAHLPISPRSSSPRESKQTEEHCPAFRALSSQDFSPQSPLISQHNSLQTSIYFTHVISFPCRSPLQSVSPTCTAVICGSWRKFTRRTKRSDFRSLRVQGQVQLAFFCSFQAR